MSPVEAGGRRRRVLAAVVLAGLAPPGGHVFVGRPLRGFALLAGSVACGWAWVLTAPLTLAHAQWMALPGLLLLLAVVLDAGLLARSSPDPLPPRRLHRWWVYLGLAVLTQYAIPDALYRLLVHRAGIVRQPDAAMEPTVLRDERVVFLRTDGADRSPERDELVVVQDDAGQLHVRRVAGLPGETVEVIDGRVRVEDREWVADRLRLRRQPDLDLPPRRLGLGDVLVLADRRRAEDQLQRAIPLDRVVGRPTWILLPPGFPADPQLGTRLGERPR